MKTMELIIGGHMGRGYQWSCQKCIDQMQENLCGLEKCPMTEEILIDLQKINLDKEI